ncbi:MAG: ABC transporter ATP-binding protein [Bacillota bacterium]|nr:ABC transporter ATP-binding protein [Bacillota bacterium]HHU42899.1 ABC transporter ATP-binding protein [Clostridiales bacterium]
MKKIVLKNLRQQYTYGAVGIQELSIELDDRETVAVLGGREAGKTSLLKCIAGLAPQTGGEIYINSRLVNSAKPKDRDVLMVYEDGGFFERRTVFYNLSYPLKIRKLDKNDITNRVVDISKKMGFEYLLDYKIYTLTLSERLRVMIARALLREASVYLFDDPFKNVQPYLRRKLFNELYPYIKNINAPKIFATSSADEAKTVADKIVILNYGFVTDMGKAEDIIKNPNCLLAYRYMYGDTSNIVKTKIQQEEDAVFIEILGQRINIEKDKLLNPIYIGKEVLVCFLLKENDKGLKAHKEYIEYVNDFKVLHGKIAYTDVKFYIDREKDEYFALIDQDTLKIFDINSQRNIYF